MSALVTALQVLQADAALEAILTGGIYNGLLVPEITRQSAPAAYDEFAELLPCGLVQVESASPWGPHADSGRIYLVVWLYAQHDYEALDAARDRIYQLLHREQLSSADGIYDCRHANDVMGAEMVALGVPTMLSRYVITVERG
jgi:hypothetical protein